MKKIITLLFGLLTLKATAMTDHPNVVFILADDLGVNDLSLYGSKFDETPNIDALAQRGLKFNQAYSAAPICSPTLTDCRRTALVSPTTVT